MFSGEVFLERQARLATRRRQHAERVGGFCRDSAVDSAALSGEPGRSREGEPSSTTRKVWNGIFWDDRATDSQAGRRRFESGRPLHIAQRVAGRTRNPLVCLLPPDAGGMRPIYLKRLSIQSSRFVTPVCRKDSHSSGSLVPSRKAS